MARLTQTELLSGLKGILDEGRLSVLQTDKIAYSSDFWPRAQIWKMAGEPARYPPDCIVWPESKEEVAEILRFCNAHLVPVVPYGAGSGVCGGTVPIHGGVVMDLKRMKSVLSIDRESMSVHVEAGLIGQNFENLLNHEGLTFSHFPSSIMCSTVGGWLATRSSGQFSSRYGSIEDMVLGLTVVLPTGEIMNTRQRFSGHPDWTQIFVGSEGTLGVIVSAELKVRPLAEVMGFQAFQFRKLDDALTGMRRLMQGGLRPTVMRLYDPFDSFIALRQHHDDDGEEESRRLKVLKQLSKEPGQRLKGMWAPLSNMGKKAFVKTSLSFPRMSNRLAHMIPSSCLLILGFEGGASSSHDFEKPAEDIERDKVRAKALLQEQIDEAKRLLLPLGASDLGPKLGETWMKHRYAMGFKQSAIFREGAWVDTMEVATTWDRVLPLYKKVLQEVMPHAFVMAHFSHAYAEGCSIYFTMLGQKGNAAQTEKHYEMTWGRAMDAVLALGATLSHHHGVGIHKKSAMIREHGGMLKTWYALKNSFDPHHIMNPGKLFPDESQDRPYGQEGGV